MSLMTAECRLERLWLAPLDTVGALYLDGLFECFVLEDLVREPGIKVSGQTAIPAGRYRITVTPSARFKEDLPLLLDVPGFEGIRIHAGNTRDDTEGCLLVGQVLTGLAPGPSFTLGNSRRSLNALLPKLKTRLAAGLVWFTITNPHLELPTP